MLNWWRTFSAQPFVAHLLRAVVRFNVRGGNALAAGIAYYSVLAAVPILMLGFSALGMTITVLRPAALTEIESWIKSQIRDDSLIGESAYEIIVRALTEWASLTVVSLGIIIWVGSSWVGNLKRAVRLVMREDVDRPGDHTPFPLDILVNFAALVGLLAGFGATFAASAISISFAAPVGVWLGIADSPGWSLAVRALGLLVALAAGAGLFRLLFAWLSPHPIARGQAWIGAGLGSVTLLVLQSLTGYLLGLFSRNLSTALFGSTLVVMIFFNLLSTLMLYIASWLATTDEPSLATDPALDLAAEPEPAAAPLKPGEETVSAEVARRSLGIGLSTGYVAGAATGLGAGAMLVSLLGRLFGRRR